MSAIIKVKKQVVPWSNKPDYGECSNEINREIHNLKVLTDAGCQHTPRLIDWSIRQQSHDDTLPGVYVAYIVMEEVPEKDLGDYDGMEKSKQQLVQLAFLEAIWNFRKCQLIHWDPRLPNLIWDPDESKCYIVDFEDVEHDPEMAAEGFSMDLWEELMTWQLTRTFDRPLVHTYGKEELIQYWKDHMDEQ
ncbi:hypothetical protein BJY00DRAFT_324869 [Aspergillus carlsbadensis]|nr:hypothetical protein BJY00DRAFT_324869 [Aspergillus carlsbadensis]